MGLIHGATLESEIERRPWLWWVLNAGWPVGDPMRRLTVWEKDESFLRVDVRDRR